MAAVAYAPPNPNSNASALSQAQLAALQQQTGQSAAAFPLEEQGAQQGLAEQALSTQEQQTKFGTTQAEQAQLDAQQGQTFRNTTQQNQILGQQEQTAFANNQTTQNSLRGLLTAAANPTPFTPVAVAAPASAAAIGPVDNSAANASAFARAKDTVGQASTGALAGLRSALGGSGMLGSGSESRGTQNIVNQGLEAEANTATGQAVTQSGQNLTAEEANQQAAVTQRAQNIQSAEAANTLALNETVAANTQRNQVIQGLVAALNAGSRAY